MLNYVLKKPNCHYRQRICSFLIHSLLKIKKTLSCLFAAKFFMNVKLLQLYYSRVSSDLTQGNLLLVLRAENRVCDQ